MSVSFLDLPKELKTYILSLYFVIHIFPNVSVVYTTCTYKNLNKIIEWASNSNTGYFGCSFTKFSVSKTLHQLSLIHPSIRTLLIHNCVFLRSQRYNFSPQFFSSIIKK